MDNFNLNLEAKKPIQILPKILQILEKFYFYDTRSYKILWNH